MNCRDGQGLALHCAEGLIRLATRPLPETERGDWTAMLTAEAYAVCHDPALGSLHREFRVLRFALSLVLHRPAILRAAAIPRQDLVVGDAEVLDAKVLLALALLAALALGPALLGLVLGVLSGSATFGIVIALWGMSFTLPVCWRLLGNDISVGSPPSILIVGDYSWMMQ